MDFARCADPSKLTEHFGGSEAARSQDVSTHNMFSKGNMYMILAALTVHILKVDISFVFQTGHNTSPETQHCGCHPLQSHLTDHQLDRSED